MSKRRRNLRKADQQPAPKTGKAEPRGKRLSPWVKRAASRGPAVPSVTEESPSLGGELLRGIVRAAAMTVYAARAAIDRVRHRRHE